MAPVVRGVPLLTGWGTSARVLTRYDDSFTRFSGDGGKLGYVVIQAPPAIVVDQDIGLVALGRLRGSLALLLDLPSMITSVDSPFHPRI